MGKMSDKGEQQGSEGEQGGSNNLIMTIVWGIVAVLLVIFVIVLAVVLYNKYFAKGAEGEKAGGEKAKLRKGRKEASDMKERPAEASLIFKDKDNVSAKFLPDEIGVEA